MKDQPYDRHRDLAWAALKPKVRASLDGDEPDLKSYVVLGAKYAELGFRFRWMLVYMETHHELTQDQRDAMERGYNRAAGRDIIVRPPPEPKVRKKRKKAVRKRKSYYVRKPKIRRDRLGRYLMPVAEESVVRIQPVTPTVRELRASAKDLILPWNELRRRYPAPLGYPGMRILFSAVIDRERLLGELAKAAVTAKKYPSEIRKVIADLVDQRIPAYSRGSRGNQESEPLAEITRSDETDDTSDSQITNEESEE